MSHSSSVLIWLTLGLTLNASLSERFAQHAIVEFGGTSASAEINIIVVLLMIVGYGQTLDDATIFASYRRCAPFSHPHSSRTFGACGELCAQRGHLRSCVKFTDDMSGMHARMIAACLAMLQSDVIFSVSRGQTPGHP